ncbi:MAG: hypothetical protein KA175_14205 [Flavobacteriales bacterium]|nr:hypothetical protein [Flavobacteriales bacterium]MBP6698768.1 hypothetical protein [Flavobacteriales bacterium]
MTTTYEDLYTSLGYLFYSIAASDGSVRPPEVEKLKQLVKEHWLPLENSRDEFGTDAGHYIDIAFDFANAERMGSDEAFARFRSSFMENRSQYDPSVRELVLRTAAAISSAFAGNNKAELTRVSELDLLFKDRT